jgi:ankyrin repeat protein
LLEASYWNRPRIVNLLLDHGADINARDGQYGNTSLCWACYKGGK